MIDPINDIGEESCQLAIQNFDTVVNNKIANIITLMTGVLDCDTLDDQVQH